MARFALAWEQGGGLGHAMSLAQVARALLGRGHHVDLIWRDPVLAQTTLGDLLQHPRLRLWAAPAWRGQLIDQRLADQPSTYADLLSLVGYLDKPGLTALLKSWLDLLRALQPDALVTEHAPTALLAAKGLPGLRTAQLGNGYFQPPRQTPLPSVRFWDPQDVDPANEAAVLTTCQAAQKACGIAPLPRLQDLLDTDLNAVLTWPELSTYAPSLLQDHSFFGPFPTTAMGQPPIWPDASNKPRYLAYLKASHPAIDAILDMLIDARLPTLLVLGGGTCPQATRLAPHGHIRLVDQLANMDQALSQADVVICQGNAGTVMASLSAGRPLLMLPGHVEQWLNSYRVCELHAGISLQATEIAEHGVAALHALIDDPHFRQHAGEVAARHPPSASQANLMRLCTQLEALPG
jgi:UDP:flavonoid glycosyltransferase YjiC (YdhE family)